MQEFKEKKIVKILDYIALTLIILGFLSLLLSFIDLILLACFIIFLLISIPFGILSFYFSDKNKYTNDFIKYIELKLSNVKTYTDLIEIKNEFNKLAIKDNVYCLSYPVNIKQLHNKILNQIEILEKIK